MPSVVATETYRPSLLPSLLPSLSSFPSLGPTSSPSYSMAPSGVPSGLPTDTASPSSEPSSVPSSSPSSSSFPSLSPTALPTGLPSISPSVSRVPSVAPSAIPSVSPSFSNEPSQSPSESAAPSSFPTETFYPGIATNLSPDSIEDQRWVKCYNDTYADGLHNSVDEIMSSCRGTYIMYGCKLESATNYALTGYGALEKAFTDVGKNITGFTPDGSISWYFSEDYSIGFFPSDGSLNREECDNLALTDTRRLCWHTTFDTSSGAGYGGFRCGKNIVNADSNWERTIWVKGPVPPTPTPSEAPSESPTTTVAPSESPTSSLAPSESFSPTLPFVPGIETFKPLVDVLDDGWTPCFTDSYNQVLYSKVPQILSNCQGKYVMYACGPVGGTVFDLVGYGNRDAAFTQTAGFYLAESLPTSTHATEDGDISWYFKDGSSMGFFPTNEKLSQIPCDNVSATSDDRRMCWRTFPNFAGFRCGRERNLGATYSRVIFTKD
eukprot:scaffold4793_cov175-Amphora_coffeaeformis.AAC.16